MSSFHHYQDRQAPQDQENPSQSIFSTGANPNDFFKNSELMQMGLSTGRDLLNKQREKLAPGLSGFWDSLKIYFAVNII